MPGFGHHLHRPDDPRTPKLFEIAMAHDEIDKRPIAMMQKLGQHVDQIYGKHLTINATGATAAVLMGAAVPVRIMRGFAVISRAAGLVAHVMEEQQNPAGRHIWDLVDNNIPLHWQCFDQTCPLKHPPKPPGGLKKAAPSADLRGTARLPVTLDAFQPRHMLAHTLSKRIEVITALKQANHP
jgi:hypothetical protein